MKLGQKSLLMGVHQFLLHPFFVAIAWTMLYGIPWNPKLWFCFLVHDWGYWFCTDIDGESGKKHPSFGANLVHFFCDGTKQETTSLRDPKFPELITLAHKYEGVAECTLNLDKGTISYKVKTTEWLDFCLYHSRYLAEKDSVPVSRLCVADKLATALVPTWLFISLATISGEIKEFEARSKDRDGGYTPNSGTSRYQWINNTRKKFREWVVENKDLARDAI